MMYDPKEVLEICEKATPEPWHIVKNHLYHSEIKSDKRELIACIETVKEGSEEHNAQFIALARIALPQLAQRVVDLEKQLESLTPGGTEFYNDPERCIQWVKDRLATVSKQVKKRKEAEADNAALVEYLESLLKYESISWMHGYIKDMIFKIHPGAALLEELEQLRAVAQDAQAMYLNWFSVYMKNPGPFHDAVINALNAAGYEVKRPLEVKEAAHVE